MSGLEMLKSKEMKDHYFNVFESENGYFCEQTAHKSMNDAIEDIADTSFPYAYTLHVSLEKVERIDLEIEALSYKYSGDSTNVSGQHIY